MKRLIFTTLMFGMVFLSSCQKKPKHLLTEIAEIKGLTPVCIAWYKPGKIGWEVNKSWYEKDEIDKIVALLTEAKEEKYAYADRKYKLSLLFYDGYPKNLKLWEVDFDVRARTFIGTVGVSKELGELFSKYQPEEVGPVMPGMDPNRIKEAQKRLQEESRKRMEAEESSNDLQYVEATIDDLVGLKFEGILFLDYYNIEEAEILRVLGNPNKLESITGKKIKAEKVVNDPIWLERVIKGFLGAERIKRGYLDDARAAFITEDKGYMIKIAADDKVVYGPDYESEQLRKDLEEIGLLEHEEPFTELKKGSGVKLP